MFFAVSRLASILPKAVRPAPAGRKAGARLTEWRDVKACTETTNYPATTLAGHLSGPESEPCGICANCIGGPVIKAGAVPVSSPGEFLAGADFELRCNGQAPGKALAIDALCGNLPVRLLAELGRVLARWAEAG